MEAFRYFFGRLLQISGMALTAYVVVLFFDPMNKEGRLLMMSLIGVAIFASGLLLLGNSRE